MDNKTAVFGAGCFWGVQAIFDAVPGVVETEAGYAGGDDVAWPDPTYRQVCSGSTGHAEVVRVVFDPQRTSYAALLDLYMSLHDPTDSGGQGPDRGSQYRSIVLATDEGQYGMTQARLAQLERSGIYESHIATRIEHLGRFWPAEQLHQHYFAASIDGHGCHYLRDVQLPPWPEA
jgi:methionine-S-sulfoxide reductase